MSIKAVAESLDVAVSNLKDRLKDYNTKAKASEEAAKQVEYAKSQVAKIREALNIEISSVTGNEENSPLVTQSK